MRETMCGGGDCALYGVGGRGGVWGRRLAAERELEGDLPVGRLVELRGVREVVHDEVVELVHLRPGRRVRSVAAEPFGEGRTRPDACCKGGAEGVEGGPLNARPPARRPTPAEGGWVETSTLRRGGGGAMKHTPPEKKLRADLRGDLQRDELHRRGVV